MAKFTCNTCGGTYDDVAPGGYTYFHTCPPLSTRELVAALGLVSGGRGDAFDESKLSLADRVKLATADRTRPGGRNENVDPSFRPPDVQPGEVPRDHTPPIVSEGKGRTEVPKV